MSASFTTDFSSEFAGLTPAQQEKVMHFIQGVRRDAIKGTPGAEILKFAGTIAHEDAEEMNAAIEKGCGQVNPDGW